MSPAPRPPLADADRRRRGLDAERRGRRGEDAAAAALVADGWTLLGRRVRTGHGELDLVAARGGLLAFVEVKARPTFALAAAAIGTTQQARVVAAATAWLATRPALADRAIRFDVLLVDASGRVRRIADAFRPA